MFIDLYAALSGFNWVITKTISVYSHCLSNQQNKANDPCQVNKLNLVYTTMYLLGSIKKGVQWPAFFAGFLPVTAVPEDT